MSFCRYGEFDSQAYAYESPTGWFIVEIEGTIDGYRRFGTAKELFAYLTAVKDCGLHVPVRAFDKIRERM